MNYRTNLNRLDLTCVVSSRQIIIRWRRISDEDSGTYCFWIKKTSPQIGNYESTTTSKGFRRSWNETENIMEAIPGCTYKIKLTYRTHSNEYVTSDTTEVTASFSQSELQQLVGKAVAFARESMIDFDYLHRCKPRVYWEPIHETKIVPKTIKDNGGQPANHINGNVMGVFFSATVEISGALPTKSPFGDYRLAIPAERILTSSTKLYFCDFYCMVAKVNRPHYVTIVACEEGSQADRFCQENLIPLNKENNPFLIISPPSDEEPIRFMSNENLWIEVYYTDDLSLNSVEKFDAVVPEGVRRSTPGGTPNNKECTVCNLYPR